MAPGALLTDLYELNMAASYLRRGMLREATFSLFVRRLPPDRGFLVAAGLEPALEFLTGFHFTDDDLAYLRDELRFDDDVLDAFASLRFEGDVWAIPEGRVPVTMTATDAAGNTTTETRMLRVDAQRPRLRLAGADGWVRDTDRPTVYAFVD